MKLKANYHTHTKLCGHAQGMTKDYVKKAIDEGYEVLGMSDHCYVPKECLSESEYLENQLDRQMNEELYHEVYLPSIAEAKEKYGDKIEILTAVEAEYLPNIIEHFQKLASELDYLNLGIHFFCHKGVVISTYGKMTATLLESYANAAIEGMETGLFKILVHPDLFMVNYTSQRGFLIFDEECERYSRMIIESAIKNNVYLEINCGGISKGKRNTNGVLQYAYPRIEFWKIVKEYPEAKIIIGVDAHKTSSLGDENIDYAKDFAEKLDLKIEEKVIFD